MVPERRAEASWGRRTHRVHRVAAEDGSMCGMQRKRRYRRFIERYEQRQGERRVNPQHPLRRFVWVLVGILLVLVGIIVGVVPGPGGAVFGFAGLFILAGEFRRVALALDRGEEIAAPRLQRFWNRMRRRKPPDEVSPGE